MEEKPNQNENPQQSNTDEVREVNDDEFPDDPELLDFLNKSHPLLTPEQKLDEDFNYLMYLIPIMFEPVEDEIDKNLCENWLERLIGIRTTELSEKRNRNLYLINLMLNMGNGKLTFPFNEPPPTVLPEGLNIFGGRPKGNVCYQDLNIEVEDFAEYSKDGRTFFAARALPGGHGAFGYLGVTLGAGDSMWLDCQGKCIDPKTIIQRSGCEKESQEMSQSYKTIKSVLSKRSPQKYRDELLPYYQELLEKIRIIMCNFGTEHEVMDPVIEKMLEDLQMDAINEGKLELSGVGCFTRKQWLCALKKKIECQMQAAEEREATLNKLEETITEREQDEITFLDVSNAVKAPKLDPILAEAARDKPSDYHVSMLKRTYPNEVVETFLKLLEQEKMQVINQERIVYRDFVMSLRAEVLKEVRRGLTKYNKARKEWRLVSNVMRKVEEEKKRILKDFGRNTATDDPDYLEKDQLINNEIDSAKIRLEEAQVQSDKVEEKIVKLHEQVHQLSVESQRLQEDEKQDTELLLKEISDLQGQVAAQERKLLLLKSKVAEKRQREACFTDQRS